MAQEWFESWFDTSYYHTLYKNRSQDEANHFITKIIDFLNPKKDAKILDLACGKGRHSITLNNLGFKVTGVDLSANSIHIATDFSNETLHFSVHDMRKIFKENTFDYVFNLFTSIGYFEDFNDNLKVVQSASKNLLPKGILMIDFLNARMVEKTLIPYEVKNIDEIEFHIYKRIDNQNVIKDIKFTDKGQDYHFTEKVTLLTLENFKTFFEQSNMTLKHHFGNYDLEAFDKENSNRLILIAEKNV